MRIFVVAFAILLTGCMGAGGPSEPTGLDDGPWQGVALSPRDYGDHFASFFDDAAAAGNVLAWGGTIDDFGKDGGAAAVTAQLWDGALFIQTSPYRQHDGSGPGTIAADGDRWRDDVVAYVDAHRPLFFGLGVEVDFLRENAPARYDELVAWYPGVYDAIKAVSPETQVFPTFQYEQMIGADSGLWGTGDGDTGWDTLADFPKRDLTAFTTYPGLAHEDPDDIPDGYYDAIATHTNGPVAFTEMGWFAETPAPGWESDAAEQGRFVEWFFAEAPTADLVVWPFLYDQAAAPDPFKSMGLRDADTGMARPAYEAWNRLR